MKKRYLAIIGLLVLCLAAGCGKKNNTDDKKDDKTPTIETKKDVEDDLVEMQKTTGVDKSKITKIIGTKSTTAGELVITNKTGVKISQLFVRPVNDEEWGEELIDGKFTIGNGEQALYYYDKEAKTDSGSKVIKYDMQIQDDNGSIYYYRNLKFSDMEEIKLNLSTDDVPYATYYSTSLKKEMSTKKEAEARVDGTYDESKDYTQEADETETPTPTPTSGPSSQATATPTATPTPTVDPSTDAGQQQQGQDTREEPNDLADQAGGYIGQNLDSLMNAVGGPNSSEYEEDPETGAEVGYHYYNGFTVSTAQQDGQEIVTGVW